MRHRRGVKQDSLELLLDTICNTFGGVLFIAILVVMLLQQAGDGPEAAIPAPSPEELESRAHQLASLAAEVLRQRQIHASQTALVDTLVPDVARKLIETRKKLLEEQEKRQSAVNALQAENAVLAASVARIQTAIEKLKTDLRTAKQKQVQARTLLASEKAGRVKDVRLPKQHRADEKEEVGIILRYGRLYLWHKYDANLRLTGLNTDDFVIIADKGDRLVTRPNPAKGIPLNDTPECQRALEHLLRRFNRHRYSMCTIVRPDSYGEFQHFRNRAIALGYDYRLLPTESDTPVSDRGGIGGLVQ